MKIASLEPNVGTISVASVELDAEAAACPGGDRLAELGEPLRARVALRERQRVDERAHDRRVGRLARVADPEVDHLDAALDRAALRLVEPDERVRVLRGEDGGEAHHG